MAGVSGYCTTLFMVRYLRTDVVRFGFLPWNLFLAWVPFVCALIISALSRRGNALLVVPMCIVWLLFLPNAPYLITDLVHLGPVREAPFWFDVLLLASFAINGLLLGFASLAMVQQSVRRRWGPVWGWLLAFVALGLCGYGIYLGRFLRWNSWDVLDSPGMLVREVGALRDPLAAHRHRRDRSVRIAAVPVLPRHPGHCPHARRALTQPKVPWRPAPAANRAAPAWVSPERMVTSPSRVSFARASCCGRSHC